MTTVVELTPENLPLITWQNLPVITTDLLADIYGAQEHQIRQNFKNNTGRFKEGVHYFKLVGEELRAFILQVDNIYLQISSKTRALMLWTERGTVRHAKILDTDKAWDVQDKLEEFYFTKCQPAPKSLPSIPAPRAKTYVKGGLELHQQDAINDFIKERLENVPEHRRGSMKIKVYSAICTKFDVKGMANGYKNIEPAHFDNIIQLIARLPLDENALITMLKEDFDALVDERVQEKLQALPAPEPSLDTKLSELIDVKIKAIQGELMPTALNDDQLIVSKSVLKKALRKVCGSTFTIHRHDEIIVKISETAYQKSESAFFESLTA